MIKALYVTLFAMAGMWLPLFANVPQQLGVEANGLWSLFSNPPQEARPWCYYLWLNGHADRETITSDLEAMKRLGFGGINLLDTRGYWDDEEHIEIPKVELVWGSKEWYDLVEFCLRECARLGIEFTMNAGASGGTLQGFVDGQPYEVDISNRDKVIAHLDRTFGPIMERAPELVGTTFTHIYSVSYEGNLKKGVAWNTIKDTFYATMREWAHAHSLKVYSESGGPWYLGGVNATLDADQLDMLAHNDFPQGEFWPLKDGMELPDAGHANRNGLHFLRGVVLSARREGRRIAAAEAFTHMLRHYSVDPAFLKPLGDIAFADGVNRLVWHTFTSSPRKFGVPGNEYFAGTHINRSVTWHKDAYAFVKYLWRCQSMLQRGDYVDDGEFENVSTNYYGWGRFRKNANAQFTTTHRRAGNVDLFFVAGEGRGDITLNASCEGRDVEIWDAVTCDRAPCPHYAAPNGKTRVTLDLPVGGSCFVVFGRTGNVKRETGGETSTYIAITNSWRVSFAYHEGIAARPPAPVEMPVLRDWTTYGSDGDADSMSIRYFSGTAIYRTAIAGNGERGMGNGNCKLSVGRVPSGLAHVFVNGIDCGVVWCAPWEVDISSAVRQGENDIEIRYTNNWHNRLVGDCFLAPQDRVTKSSLHYWTKARSKSDPGRLHLELPTVYSGPSISDPLQPSGIVGPVYVKVEGNPERPFANRKK
jgi:hypothetical protein